MALDQTANLIKVQVDGSHSDTDTTIQLVTGEASNCPDPADGEYNMVWWDINYASDPADDPNAEIVRVTGRNTTDDTLTVSRGQEDTSASTKNNTDGNYHLILGITSKMITDIDALDLQDVSSITTDEETQLANIDSKTITNTQWGYLGTMSAQPVETLGDLGLVSELANLTSDEVTELENIGSTGITNTQWGYLGGLDQALSTTDEPNFSKLTVDNGIISGDVGTIGFGSGDFELTPTSGNDLELQEPGGSTRFRVHSDGSGVEVVSGTLDLNTNNLIVNDGSDNELTPSELAQLATIGSNTISNSQWGYLGAMSAQPIESASELNHNDLSSISSGDHHTKYALTDDLASGEISQLQNINSVGITNTQWGYLGAMSAQPLEDITGEVIGDLSDVGTSSPASGEVLKYDGSNWVNGSSGGGFPDSPSQGDIVYYDGTDWVSLSAGTAGQVLTTEGSGANPQWTSDLSGDIQVFNTAGSYTWNKPTGADIVLVYVFGAGGGGGGGIYASDDEFCAGTGGGGGELRIKRFRASDISDSITVNVGAGGSGGGADSNGNAGENSSFGNLITANGGQGGRAGNTSSSNFTQSGGNGGGTWNVTDFGRSIPSEKTSDGYAGLYAGGAGGGYNSTEFWMGAGGDSLYAGGGGGMGETLDDEATPGGGHGYKSAGHGGAAGNNSSDGGDGDDAAGILEAGDGGGGASGTFNDTAGDGGMGGAPSGAGGGGGGYDASGGTAGSGGDGARGQVVVISFGINN